MGGRPTGTTRPVRGGRQRRPARQLILGLLPLVVICVVVLVALLVRDTQLRKPLDAATASATATVSSVHIDGASAVTTLAWSDSGGHRHTTTVALRAGNAPEVGASTTLHYVPGDPGRAYVGGDAPTRRLDAVVGGAEVVLLLLIVGIGATAVRIVRRRRASRRRAVRATATRVRVRVGLITRMWLAIADDRGELWLPVYWEPVLCDVLADAPCTLRGAAAAGLTVVEIDGQAIWASGPARRRVPKGGHTAAGGRWSKNALARRAREGFVPHQPISLRRQARHDVLLVLAAPVLGLLWAYLENLGPAGFGIATVVLAGVLFWAPAMWGSDPS